VAELVIGGNASRLDGVLENVLETRGALAREGPDRAVHRDSGGGRRLARASHRCKFDTKVPVER